MTVTVHRSASTAMKDALHRAIEGEYRWVVYEVTNPTSLQGCIDPVDEAAWLEIYTLLD